MARHRGASRETDAAQLRRDGFPIVRAACGDSLAKRLELVGAEWYVAEPLSGWCTIGGYARVRVGILVLVLVAIAAVAAAVALTSAAAAFAHVTLGTVASLGGASLAMIFERNILRSLLRSLLRSPQRAKDPSVPRERP